MMVSRGGIKWRYQMGVLSNKWWYQVVVTMVVSRGGYKWWYQGVVSRGGIT